MKKGFSLVELSIVLVIVGVIITGLLAARSMTGASKISKEISQIQQFDSAVATFKSEYGYLPGDAPQFGGDGDGAIDMATSYGIYVNNTDVFVGDLPAFFNNLFPNLYIATGSQTYVGASANLPSAAMGSRGSYIMAAVDANAGDHCGWDGSTMKGNYYGIVGSAQNYVGNYRTYNTSISNGGAKPEENLALDKKMDNGIANTGIVMSGNVISCGGQNVGALQTSSTTTPLSTCSSGGSYSVNSDTYSCNPMIRINSQGQ